MIQAVVSGLLSFSKRHFLQIVSYIITTRRLFFHIISKSNPLITTSLYTTPRL